MTSKRERRLATERHNSEVLARLSAERVARGVCRHCGGPVPCTSEFGDAEVGVRHSSKRKGRK